MESYTIKHLTFTYPNAQRMSLSDISLTINQGELIVLCGQSGCGKTTLLRQLKTCLQPAGTYTGEVYFEGKLLQEVDLRTQSEKIGFVLQNPETQIVTDKVWHELAFGLESLGYSQAEICTRVAEMATFFGIQNWFHKKTSELSGGQKQLLNLAAIMVMQPTMLLLDEPTSQLDPIAAHDFIETVIKLNREFGTTILLTEHRLEEVFPKADRVIVMEKGHILIDAPALQVGEKLHTLNHEMFKALPEPMRIYARVKRQVPSENQTLSKGEAPWPMTVREGRNWLEVWLRTHQFQEIATPMQCKRQDATPIIELKETWFRYEKEGIDILKALSLKIYSGEIYTLVGGNGTGKTTSLAVMSGLLKPYKGKVLIAGKAFKQSIKEAVVTLGVLPQDPKVLFVKQTVDLELEEMLKGYKKDEKRDLLGDKLTKIEMKNRVIAICQLQNLLAQHPYDLSGGEQQRVALAKVLLLQPQILFLDEPTKGLDAHYKETLGSILSQLKAQGITIVMVSHDLTFCAAYADRCGMFFDGRIVSEAEPRSFFAGKSFYTTATNRMMRSALPYAILPEDVNRSTPIAINKAINKTTSTDINKDANKVNPTTKYKLVSRIGFLMPLMVGVTIYIGVVFLDDRKYNFISLMIILETLLPFMLLFESRRPRARDVVLMSSLCAIGVVGRIAFFMVPQFKPMVAIIIISGLCLGAERGFLIGAMTSFASNIFFGQGPWTPWQMFACGIIGFLAGKLSQYERFKANKVVLCIFGAVMTFCIYGGIMNAATVIMWQEKITKPMFIAAYIQGIPFDFIHMMATIIFLSLLGRPMIYKIERIKIKYGMLAK